MPRRRQIADILYGKRVMLRSFTSGDFEQWREIRESNHDWLVKWEPTRDFYDVNEYLEKAAFTARADAWEVEWRSGRGHQFGIFLPIDKKPKLGRSDKSGMLIGELNVSSIQRGVFQNCSLGYWIDQRHAGNSYVPEAAAMAFRFAFEDLRLHRVQIAIVPRNAPSLRVVEKLGLRKEGLAERYLEINGEWEDHYIFAITLEEYTERKDELNSQWL